MFFYSKDTMNKTVKVILWIFFICVFIVGCSEVSDKMHKTLHPQQAKQESIKAKKTKQTGNRVLNKQLESDRKLAQSNTNSNQTDPNSGLNYTNYVNSIKYDGNTDITIHVNDNFMALDEQQRASIINSAQGMAKSALWQNKVISKNDVQNNLFTTIRLGSDPVGHSKVSNLSTFKWYK